MSIRIERRVSRDKSIEVKINIWIEDIKLDSSNKYSICMVKR